MKKRFVIILRGFDFLGNRKTLRNINFLKNINQIYIPLSLQLQVNPIFY